ncbi:hypothetical protein GS966_19990 [Rhodococcus hoagii]|nr:hypothetical protein [Prescottella equi]NKS73140.1 hypothetical protein [Prescottella equi]NKZ92208.1 hypothetical protein [Prescottella equi]
MSRVVQLIKRDRYGNDEIVLDVNGPNRGRQGIKLAEGLEGIYHAPRTSTSETSAFFPGSMPGLDRVEERVLKMPLITEETDENCWEDVDSLLWEVMAPGQFFVMRVESKDGNHARELNLRRVREPEAAYRHDPNEDGKMKWIVAPVAHDPWWYAEEFRFTLKRSDMSSTGGNTYAGLIEVENLGDQDTYLEFVSNQIVTAATWTLPDALGRYPAGHKWAGQQVTHTLPQLGPGKEFQVNTHPLIETLLVRDDSQEWAKMRAEDFEFALPARTERTQLLVSVKGGAATDELTVYIRQPYDRPWGW